MINKATAITMFRAYRSLRANPKSTIFLTPKIDKMTSGGIIGEIYLILMPLVKKVVRKKSIEKKRNAFFSALKAGGSFFMR